MSGTLLVRAVVSACIALLSRNLRGWFSRIVYGFSCKLNRKSLLQKMLVAYDAFKGYSVDLLGTINLLSFVERAVADKDRQLLRACRVFPSRRISGGTMG